MSTASNRKLAKSVIPVVEHDSSSESEKEETEQSTTATSKVVSTESRKVDSSPKRSSIGSDKDSTSSRQSSLSSNSSKHQSKPAKMQSSDTMDDVEDIRLMEANITKTTSVTDRKSSSTISSPHRKSTKEDDSIKKNISTSSKSNKKNPTSSKKMSSERLEAFLYKKVRQIYDEESAKPYVKFQTIPLEETKSKFEHYNKQILEQGGIASYPKNDKVSKVPFYLLGVTKDMQVRTFYPGRPDDIYPSPTQPLRAIYEDHEIPTKSVKGWEQTTIEISLDPKKPKEISKVTFGKLLSSDFRDKKIKKREVIENDDSDSSSSESSSDDDDRKSVSNQKKSSSKKKTSHKDSTGSSKYKDKTKKSHSHHHHSKYEEEEDDSDDDDDKKSLKNKKQKKKSSKDKKQESSKKKVPSSKKTSLHKEKITDTSRNTQLEDALEYSESVSSLIKVRQETVKDVASKLVRHSLVEIALGAPQSIVQEIAVFANSRLLQENDQDDPPSESLTDAQQIEQQQEEEDHEEQQQEEEDHEEQQQDDPPQPQQPKDKRTVENKNDNKENSSPKKSTQGESAEPKDGIELSSSDERQHDEDKPMDVEPDYDDEDHVSPTQPVVTRKRKEDDEEAISSPKKNASTRNSIDNHKSKKPKVDDV